MRRVFQNIVENSFKYAEEDCKIIFKAVSEGNSVNIEVSDNGNGVPEEHINKIFDRFYRVDSSRCRESGGTGLGLAICKEIIENHGGKIIAKNLPKGGFVLIINFNLENVNQKVETII
jgi:signal transduction histidine kinase